MQSGRRFSFIIVESSSLCQRNVSGSIVIRYSMGTKTQELFGALLRRSEECPQDISKTDMNVLETFLDVLKKTIPPCLLGTQWAQGHWTSSRRLKDVPRTLYQDFCYREDVLCPEDTS